MTDTTTTEAQTEAETPPAIEAPAPEQVPFWHRPYVERYLTPLVLPVAVIVGIIVYVLNISRLFLSAHGHLPVVIGTVITVMILVGATMLSAAPKLRNSSIVLITAAFVLSIFSAGWITLGHSQEKKEAVAQTLPDSLKTKQTLKVTAGAGGELKFVPASAKATTGLVRVEIAIAAPSHTFTFDSPETQFKLLDLTGAKAVGVGFFPKAGDYAFHCTTPGHLEGGMKGVVHVTGPTVTLAEALKDAGNPPTAAAG